ncbi:MAG: ATP-grasp domain-containing protein [Dysgonamonadaceae bacterium]|nr:ATP-grasp domain-containing protein [Dysgonamonadaceae bacterium]
MDKKSILIFGVGPLQKSIIERSKLKGLYTVGIDPMEDAVCKDEVDAFEVVDGQDFEKTLEVAKRYNVKGIITAATDKPLVMMARVAEHLNLPFFSIQTAEWSTDKLLMKEKFMEADIPCAKGLLLNDVSELEGFKMDYPLIVKPRDNSGSRGVIYCKDLCEVEQAVQEALQYTKKKSVLIEEFIEGKEYSIEAIHYNGKTHIIQFTEKITTDFPYNVEIGHIQPADISSDHQDEIKSLVGDIAQALKFKNCASHTEVKINEKGVFVIESSPRLGGDFITSTLVPLSTGLNMEDLLIAISLGKSSDSFSPALDYTKHSGIIYFEIEKGVIISILGLEKLKLIHGIQKWEFDLKSGDKITKPSNSLDRHGYAIFQTDTKKELEDSFYKCKAIINKQIIVEL